VFKVFKSPCNLVVMHVPVDLVVYNGKTAEYRTLILKQVKTTFNNVMRKIRLMTV